MTNDERDAEAPDEDGVRSRGARPQGGEEPGHGDEPADGDDGGRGDGRGGGGDGAEPEGGEEGVDAELDRLRDEFQGLEDRHLRLAAEFNNFRRRAEAERTEAWSRAQAELVGRLLEPLDDLQRVGDLDGESATVESLLEGVELVVRKLRRTLEEAGAELVDPQPGETFDPEAMEALMRVPTEEPEEDDTVEAVFQPGYRFRGHLVRPARVSVRKHD